MYQSKLSLIETEIAIKLIKDTFEKSFANRLNLLRVSAPLFVDAKSGLNDNLNGVERAVSFQKEQTSLEIVQSLAKWKRLALYRYGFKIGEGIYTDMNAIRQDEDLSFIHSLYVDQWDWELIIEKHARTRERLNKTVENIYAALLETEHFLTKKYPILKRKLPDHIKFIDTDDLENMYPNLSSKSREHKIAQKYGAVFITKIGGLTKSGQRHDTRSPDYDDWSLNGDIIVWADHLKQSLELSSMGIRVDKETLKSQLSLSNTLNRLDLPYHQMIVQETLPQTIGGGIGQSRLCMFLLEKAHIGEVQSSYWTEEIIKTCQEKNIFLL
jgi:aspartate--ammonia ligase